MKKIITICINLMVTLNIGASEINSENLRMDDLGTFMIKKLHLSVEESKKSADELYEKGMQLYNQTMPTKTINSTDGKSYNYSSQSAKKESMSYLIASGLLGDPRASVVAINYLVNTKLDNGQYRYILAKSLSDSGYLYGTYVLGLGYVNGNGINRDRDNALYYLGIVKDYCQTRNNETYKSLASDKINVTDENKLIKIGKRRCQIAILTYKHTKDTDFTTNTPHADTLKASKAFRDALNQRLINKQDEALKKYLLENKR